MTTGTVEFTWLEQHSANPNATVEHAVYNAC